MSTKASSHGKSLPPLPWAAPPPSIPGLSVHEDNSDAAWDEWMNLRAANPTAKFGLIASPATPAKSHVRYEPVSL